MGAVMTSEENCALAGQSVQQIAEKIVYRTVEDFVAHVIYDGRFLDSFTLDPNKVADQLGVGLSPDVAEALHGRDRGQVLAEVTERMTRDHGERTMDSITRPSIYADFGISATVVVGAIAILVVAKACFCQMTIVEDRSADSDSKL